MNLDSKSTVLLFLDYRWSTASNQLDVKESNAQFWEIDIELFNVTFFCEIQKKKVIDFL